MARTGAQLLVETLAARGVRHLLTVSGTHVRSNVRIEGAAAPFFPAAGASRGTG